MPGIDCRSSKGKKEKTKWVAMRARHGAAAERGYA